MLGRARGVAWQEQGSTEPAFLNGHTAGGHKYPRGKQSTPQTTGDARLGCSTGAHGCQRGAGTRAVRRCFPPPPAGVSPTDCRQAACRGHSDTQQKTTLSCTPVLQGLAGRQGRGHGRGRWEAPPRAGTGPVTAPRAPGPRGGPAPCAGRGGASVGGGAPGSPGRHRPALSVPAAAGGTRALLRSRGGGVRPRPRAVAAAASAARAPPSPGGGIAPGSSEEKEEEEAEEAAAGLRGAASAPSSSRSARLRLRLHPLAPGWALGSRGAMSARRRRAAAEEEETTAAEEEAGSDKVRARGRRPLAAVGAGVRARAAPAPPGEGRGRVRAAALPPPADGRALAATRVGRHAGPPCPGKEPSPRPLPALQRCCSFSVAGAGRRRRAKRPQGPVRGG